MRILRPPKYLCDSIVEGLRVFFDTEHEPEFKRAIGKVCRFYKLPHPRVVWFERLANPKRGGECFENGTVHLVHPDNWKRNRKYNGRQQWVALVLHEMGHYALWAKSGRVTAETKADRFCNAILRGAA